jgi:hypothetical protein
VDHLDDSVADVARLLQRNPGSVKRRLETPRGAVDRREMVSRIVTLLSGLYAFRKGL